MLTRSLRAAALLAAASLSASGASAATPEEIKACDTGFPLDKKIAACTKLVNNDKESVDVRIKALVSRAWAHSGQDNYDAAYKDVSAAIALDPQRGTTYDTRARLMVYTGEIDRPIADFTAAIELQPRSYSLFSRGELYAKKGDQERANADFKQAIVLMTAYLQEHPESNYTYKSRSDAYRNLGEIDKALDDFAEYMNRRKPTDYFRISDRGDLYLRKGDFDRAIADYSEALAKEPDNQEFQHRRALAYRLKGDTRNAIAQYDKIIDYNDSNDFEAYIGRGLAYALAGKPQRAAVDFTRAIDIFPEGETAYYDRAQAMRDSGNIDLAISDYSAAIERNPRYAVAFNSRGRAYLAKNDAASALKDFDEAIRIDDKFAAAYCNRAMLHQSQGRLDDAIADFGRAIALDPTNKDFLMARAAAHGAKGAHAEADADFTAALAIDPVDATAYVGRAAARLKRGALRQALADADRALVIDKELPAVYRVRGDIDAALGYAEKAAADREAAVRAQAKQDEKRRAAEAARKLPPMRITIVGDYPRSPAYLKMNFKFVPTVVELKGDEITYKVEGLPTYKIASGDQVADKFPGMCNGKPTTNMGDRVLTASLDKYLVHIQRQSHLDFTTGACRGRFNYYQDNFLIDLSDGGCKFSYLQKRSVLGNSDMDARVLEQTCKAEVLK
jgi:tetratricopeptide (TPR) repeat protein